MSIERINLRKFLQLVMADGKQRTSLLRDDIRSEIRKERGETGNGGDFFAPFWAAAKGFARSELNLDIEIQKLIAANLGRKRLYTAMAKSFREWWNEKRAWRNDPFEILDENVKCLYEVPDQSLTIKIENLIAGKIGEDVHRLVYPYFAEKPLLSLEGARLGLYILHQALGSYTADSFRVLDLLRGISFSTNDVPFTGNEATELKNQFQIIASERLRLRAEYV